MKNRLKIKYIAIAAMAFIVLSCGENWLETEPQGLVLESNFYRTEDDAMAALAAAYDPLEWDYMSGLNGSYNPFFMLMNISSDDSEKGGDTPTDQANMEQFDDYNLNPDNEMVRGLWVKYARGIYRCNLVLENTSDDFGTSATIKAEAQTLRAYYFFDAVRLWGDYPMLDHVLGPDEYYSTGRVPKREIFDLIVSDLTTAINSGALKRLAQVPGGRITVGAAHALLGKVYLYMASPYYAYNDEDYYQLAADEFASVIQLGDYELIENYADVNDPRLGQNTNEAVFEIQHSARSEWSDWNNATPGEGNFAATLSGIRTGGTLGHPIYSNGWCFNVPNQNNVDAYIEMEDDIRFSANIITSFPVEVGGVTIPSDLGVATDTSGRDVSTDIGVNFAIGYQHTGYWVKKYAIYTELIPTVGNQFHNNPNNMVAIRYSDVLLMHAEALVSGASDPLGAAAVDYVNEVRERVDLDLLGSVDLDAILAERRLELDQMGHRWFDMIRLNRAVTVFGPQGFTPGHEVFPIPRQEIDNTKGALEQNEAYK